MVAVNATELSQFKLEFIVLVVTRAGHLQEPKKSADFENVFVQILDSRRDFNRFLDPAIAADCRFIDLLGLDFGLCV